MKEIKYSGDLGKDIKESNGVVSETYLGLNMEEYLLLIFFLGMQLVGYELGLLNEVLISVFSVIFYIKGLVFTKLDNKKVVRGRIKSVKQLRNLANELNDENVLVDRKDLQEAVEIKEEVQKNYSNEEKIVHYFALLDKEDQIQVLKQVRTQIIGFRKSDTAEEELFLLEEEDKQNMSIPVRRVLKKDK